VNEGYIMRLSAYDLTDV